MLTVFLVMKLSLLLVCVLLLVLPFMQGCDSGDADNKAYYKYIAPLTGETVEDELAAAMSTRRKLQEGKEVL